MKKAFFFDMDGVLADSEGEWNRLGYDNLLKEHFGEELFAKVKTISGVSIKDLFDNFVSAGWRGDYQSFHEANMRMAEKIYDTIPLSPNIEELIDALIERDFVIGIVSGSPLEWVNTLISRLKNKSKISLLLSVNNHKTLKAKPSPDPYLYAMKQLNMSPEDTIVLEDSVPGVNSAKEAGAKVICLTEHHKHSWQTMPANADYYAASMKEVQAVVDKILSK